MRPLRAHARHIVAHAARAVQRRRDPADRHAKQYQRDRLTVRRSGRRFRVPADPVEDRSARAASPARATLKGTQTNLVRARTPTSSSPSPVSWARRRRDHPVPLRGARRRIGAMARCRAICSGCSSTPRAAGVPPFENTDDNGHHADHPSLALKPTAARRWPSSCSSVFVQSVTCTVHLTGRRSAAPRTLRRCPVGDYILST